MQSLRGTKIALSLAFSLLSFGCSQTHLVAGAANQLQASPVADYTASKLIGIHPLVPVKVDGSNLSANLRASLDAFGIVALGDTGSCTGTHLGNGYVLTAGHCFLEGAATDTMANQPCPTTKVYWGYRGSPATGSPKPAVTSISQCTKVVYAELTDALDFAIFQVDVPPPASIPVAPESARTAANTKVTIFGYPQGRPLEWSQYCSVKRNTVAPDAINSASRFAHQCDTEPGNSGSSILSVSLSGALAVVGVHDAAAPDPLKYNIGTYMFDIRQKLVQNGVDLDALTSSQNARIH